MTTEPESVDRDLLTRFTRERDAKALGALAERYDRSLLGLAKGLLGGNESLACEAVQNAWVRVIRYGRSFAGQSTVKTWLYRIVINQCRSLREREQRQMRLRLGTASSRTDHRTPSGPGAGLTSRAGPRAGPEGVTEAGADAVETAAHRDALTDAIASLTDAQRDVVLVCYHAGLTHEQAADVLGLPIGTLKSRLHAALAALRRVLLAGGVQAT